MRIVGAIIAQWRRVFGSGASTLGGPPPLPGASAWSRLQSLTPPPLRAASALPASGWRRVLRTMNWKWRVLLGIPLATVALMVPLFAFLMIYYTVSFPHPLAMRAKERAPVIRILARDGSVLAERGVAHDYMPLDLLPRHVVGAVVAIEDRRFFQHAGLDPWGFARAVFANLRAGRLAQGGSTLTQQLAKNLFLSSERTFSRKLEELALALWLELRLSKADILELYLNRVYFGAGAYGIEAASQRYFDKSARALSVAEAALIAGLLKAPSKYSPIVSPEAARTRGRIVITKMAETGFITPDQEERALAERINFNRVSEPTVQQSGLDYAVDFVLEHLPPLIGSGHGEIVVETTLDVALQKRAGEIVAQALRHQADALGVSQAALVVLDNEGGIRALVGGRDYADSQFNRAVKARRQPGSAFKPFVYLAALERGMTPETVAYDLPLTIDGWAPRNDNGQFVGRVSLRQALAQSINTVAVRLNQEVGRGTTASVARRLGVRSDLRDDPTLALGTSEVTLLEMASAYAVLANGGTAIKPHAIRRVRMSSGRVIFAREGTSAAQIVDPQIAGEMSSMLNTAMMSGTGRRAAIPLHPAAGKTGTSQEFRDAWFLGYTAHLTAGVWIGNDNSRPMKRAMGGGLPAEIWHELMLTAHVGKAPLALPGTSFTPPAESTSDASNALLSDARTWSEPTLPPRPEATPDSAEQPRRLEGASRQASAREPTAAPSRNTRVAKMQRAVRAAKGTAAKGAPSQPNYPKAPISEDFIARAIAETPDTEPGADPMPEVAEDTPPPPAERPRGMMSLGAWW